MREHKIWKEVLERFEQQAPSAVMTHLALDQALPSIWIDEVFLEHRQRQYPCELLFSSVVELMLLVTLGLRPSLHAGTRKLADWLLPLLWSNLPSDIDAATITRLYRKRWRIEGMFGRLESVLNSEIKKAQAQGRSGQRLRGWLHRTRSQTGHGKKTLKGMAFTAS